MKKKSWITMLFILIILGFAQTQCLASGIVFLSGNDLVPLMREYDKYIASPSEASATPAAISYVWYINGVWQGAVWLEKLPGKSGAKGGQVAAIVSKYLNEHPEKWGEPAVSLIIRALQEAFPSKDK